VLRNLLTTRPNLSDVKDSVSIVYMMLRTVQAVPSM
jgi:hypothetical protein